MMDDAGVKVAFEAVVAQKVASPTILQPIANAHVVEEAIKNLVTGMCIARFKRE